MKNLCLALCFLFSFSVLAHRPAVGIFNVIEKADMFSKDTISLLNEILARQGSYRTVNDVTDIFSQQEYAGRPYLILTYRPDENAEASAFAILEAIGNSRHTVHFFAMEDGDMDFLVNLARWIAEFGQEDSVFSFRQDRYIETEMLRIIEELNTALEDEGLTAQVSMPAIVEEEDESALAPSRKRRRRGGASGNNALGIRTSVDSLAMQLGSSMEMRQQRSLEISLGDLSGSLLSN